MKEEEEEKKVKVKVNEFHALMNYESARTKWGKF